MADKTLTLAGAARRAGVSPMAVRMWILTEKLPAKKLERGFEIQETDLDRVAQEVKEASGQLKRDSRGRFEPLD